MEKNILQRVKIILFDSYIQAIKNSIGSSLFKNLYARVGSDAKTDILKSGQLSCAFFASSILYIFKLISNVHATVNGTKKDMDKSGWLKIIKPREGAVLIWEPEESDGETHQHIGFYMGDNEAISNNTNRGFPEKHHWTFGEKDGKPIRKVEKIYWYKKLDTK